MHRIIHQNSRRACKPNLLFLFRSSQVSIHSIGLTWSFALNYRLGNTHAHTVLSTYIVMIHHLFEPACVQSRGLWQLYSDMELNMIPVLAGERHFDPPLTAYIFALGSTLQQLS